MIYTAFPFGKHSIATSRESKASLLWEIDRKSMSHVGFHIGRLVVRLGVIGKSVRKHGRFRFFDFQAYILSREALEKPARAGDAWDPDYVPPPPPRYLISVGL